MFVWTVIMIYLDLLPIIIVELFLREYKVEKNIINNICQLGEQVVLPFFSPLAQTLWLIIHPTYRQLLSKVFLCWFFSQVLADFLMEVRYIITNAIQKVSPLLSLICIKFIHYTKYISLSAHNFYLSNKCQGSDAKFPLIFYSERLLVWHTFYKD